MEEPNGPQNAVVGDAESPTQIPQTQVPQDLLAEEKKLAKFSKTSEFKRLEKHILERIEFFQKYFPDGQPIAASKESDAVIASHWRAANIVIAEFQEILNAYEGANEAVRQSKNARREDT